MKNSTRFVVVALVALALCGCASANPSVMKSGDAPGFWWGLWNGMTIWASFWGRLFSDNIGIYETVNSGRLYDLGFWLGLGGLGWGCSRRHSK